jgi:hypothetical protein
MVLKYVYLVLAVAGTILPMSQFIPASLAGEFSIAAMIADSTATPLATGVTLDLAVAASTGLLFIIVEAIRRRIKLAWIAIAGTFLIGFSFGLPFFLFLRQLQIDRQAAAIE